FPESHAASFALLVYVSCWLKHHHPDVFAAAILNSQPMGFYAPAQLVRDAREHNVEVREADVNFSDWDCTLEPLASAMNGYLALRLGFSRIDGLMEDEIEKLLAHRGEGYDTPADIRRRAGVTRKTLEILAAADAFRSMGLDRRQALWAVRGEARDKALPLFSSVDAAEQGAEPDIRLPQTPLSEHVLQDYQTTRLSLKAHPISFLRARYARMGFVPTREARASRNGARVMTAGVILVRQMPGTASGVVFMTIEDEVGIANLVIWPRVLKRFRPTVMGARIIAVRGRVQTADNVTHIVADSLVDRTGDLSHLSEDAVRQALGRTLAHADEIVKPVDRDPRLPKPGSARQGRIHPRDLRIIPNSRDFH
ncbi:MAG: OB-fold nucleic acid binding domain-containing protein, partial [Pseudomonadota bacterium]